MSANDSIVAIGMATMLLCGFASAEIITVGGKNGWDFAMNGWPNGRTFQADDVLLFKYNSVLHNVVIVSKENYDSCTSSGPTRNSGHDTITLSKGTSYYICGIPGHCEGGMKIAVTAV